MCIRVGFYSLVKGLKHEGIVVTVADNIGDDSPVIEVQDGAQIDLADFETFIPLEFRYIGEPFFIRFLRMELAVQQVLGQILWILGLSGAAMVAVLNSGFDAFGPADTQDPFIVHVYPKIVPEIIVDPTVALIWTLHMNLLYFLGNLLVPGESWTLFSGKPFVIGGSGYLKLLTGGFYWIAFLSMAFFDSPVKMALSYL